MCSMDPDVSDTQEVLDGIVFHHIKIVEIPE